MSDKYNLERFVEAQKPVYARVVNELSRGMKQGHWMWFIFPQIIALGTSEMSRKYAIKSLAEAVEYLKHPVLGPRLRECSQLAAAIRNRSIHVALGSPDDDKLQSSMTLFSVASPDRKDFLQVLTTHYSGEPDRKTLRILKELLLALGESFRK